jgi:hypothetical protein
VAAKIPKTEATASRFSNGCFTGIKNKKYCALLVYQQKIVYNSACQPVPL